MKLKVQRTMEIEVELRETQRGITLSADGWNIATLSHEGTLLLHGAIDSPAFQTDAKRQIVVVPEVDDF